MTPSSLRSCPVRDRNGIGNIRSSNTLRSVTRITRWGSQDTRNARLTESPVRLINRILTQSYQSGDVLSPFIILRPLYHRPLSKMEDFKPPSTKQLKNEEALTKYAAFLCGLMLLVIGIRWLRNIYITSPHLKTSASLSTYGREACLLVLEFVKASEHLVGSKLILFTEFCRDDFLRHGLGDLLWGSP